MMDEDVILTVNTLRRKSRNERISMSCTCSMQSQHFSHRHSITSCALGAGPCDSEICLSSIILGAKDFMLLFEKLAVAMPLGKGLCPSKKVLILTIHHKTLSINLSKPCVGCRIYPAFLFVSPGSCWAQVYPKSLSFLTALEIFPSWLPF